MIILILSLYLIFVKDRHQPEIIFPFMYTMQLHDDSLSYWPKHLEMWVIYHFLVSCFFPEHEKFNLVK